MLARETSFCPDVREPAQRISRRASVIRRTAAVSLRPDQPSVGTSETSSICIQVSW